MKYHSKFHHPEHGEMLNKTESAKYLGISRRKFDRIAPSPTVMQQGVYPFWPKRVLEVLPLGEAFNVQKVLDKGRQCGEYLVGELTDEDLRILRNELSAIEMGGRTRNHTCGFEDVVHVLTGLEAAEWLMQKCNCPSTPADVEITSILERYKINKKEAFRSVDEALCYRSGLLSAIKNFVRKKISMMDHKEACRYIAEFWGGGSYSALLVENR